MKTIIRRTGIASALALMCLSVTVFPLLGCPQQSTIAALTQTLGNAAANLASLEGNPALGAKLQTDTTAAVTAINNWKSGTNAQMAIEALNLVADDLSLFPVTNQYAPLIDLAIGTVESILALLPQTPVPATKAAAHRRSVHLSNPPKNAKEFKKTWNTIVSASPSLAPVAIK